MYSNEKQYWTVGYSEWGRWQVRKADVEEPYKYTLVEDLGPELLDAALEFDGDFGIIGDSLHFSLFTEDLPWLFVVTTSKKLYVKKVREDISKAKLLATDVTQISVCRSFKSNTFGKDLGLVVAYLKSDGSVYTKVRTILSEGLLDWGEETQIEEAGTGNTKVQVFRLNDFRTGVYVQGCNKLFVTYREYVSNTIKTEHVSVQISDEFSTVPFRDESKEGAQSLTILSAERVGPDLIRVHANYPMFDQDPTFSDKRPPVKLTKSTVASEQIDHIYFQDGDLFIVLKIPTTATRPRFWFQTDGLNRMGYFVSPQCKPIWPVLSFATPDSEPVHLATDYVSVDVSSAVTQFKMTEKREYTQAYTEYNAVVVDSTITQYKMVQISRKSSSYTDNVSVDISVDSLTFTTTQTGTSPI